MGKQKGQNQKCSPFWIATKLHDMLCILSFLLSYWCSRTMSCVSWTWHCSPGCGSDSVRQLFSFQLFLSVPPYSWHEQSRGSKSGRTAAGFISRMLCSGLKSGWRSRAFFYQKREARLNLIVSGLFKEVFWFGALNMKPEGLNIVFKSWPNGSIQWNSSRNNHLNFLHFHA